MTEVRLLSDKALNQLLTSDKVIAGIMKDIASMTRGNTLDKLRIINHQQRQARQYLSGLNMKASE